ncbi:YbdK family carboxylate-amine ligase [Nocardioides albidus]|uniref:Putative glutamate--cysteine ligase 2 n=1 Tax=Nocardioides albidus TaxID=1517589 RepID=A0A5C4VW30_9ACTN|nr:glutamate--cysteine ligase [Nocardioides albidus]TNM39575.1 YbdK family carboxylate-amine ligase [Nocardioides albidus]
MVRRTLGVEEELLLVDPETREPAPRAEQALRNAAQLEPESAAALDHELFAHQLETRTPPVTDAGELRDHLVRLRRLAARAAEAAGALTAATGAVPLAGGPPRTTRDDRYLAMVDTFGEIARPGGTCGQHVHVYVESDDEGVRAIDAIMPWLPVLLAISANSPFYHRRDTRYASWRSQAWAQWPSACSTERFGSADAYHALGRALIASGAAMDDGMLYFDARLSAHQPTVEVRIGDVCTDPDDATLVAVLARALVCQEIDGGGLASGCWRAELLRAARWRAGRYGLTDRLLDPVSGELTPARQVLDHLVAAVRERLEEYGDADLVHDAMPRVLAHGGATWQRVAFERSDGSIPAVVDDLVVRTNAD